MKKYIFLLFNLIYLIGFSTDVKNITRRLSDKQIENINSVEDFFSAAFCSVSSVLLSPVQ